MTIDHAFLANLWGLIIGLVLTLYVVLDGFDLGIGMLSLFTPDEPQRATMMSSIGAFWDANETWLVIAGGALFGAFPVAYSVLLNALYIPLTVMLAGLIFRAVSFEFRSHSDNKAMWEFVFGAGSLVAVIGQGSTLGGLVSGISVVDGRFTGGPWDWLTPLSMVMTVAVGFGYAILGASYLLARTEGPMHRRIHRVMIACSVLMFAAVVAVTIIMPFIFREISRKWFVHPLRFVLYALSFGALFAFVIMILATVYRRNSRLPFIFSLLLFVIAFAGLLAVIHPYIVPTSITITMAAASSGTLVFMFFGIGLLIPVMLAYNFYMYRVFRGHLEQAAKEQQESY